MCSRGLREEDSGWGWEEQAPIPEQEEPPPLVLQ